MATDSGSGAYPIQRIDDISTTPGVPTGNVPPIYGKGIIEPGVTPGPITSIIKLMSEPPTAKPTRGSGQVLEIHIRKTKKKIKQIFSHRRADKFNHDGGLS
jgi:hypothetical protein